MSKINIKIAVAAHKSYRMPDDDIYLPIHVGAEGKKSIGYQRDNTGDNISIFNPYFCELTGLYWMWKNSKADYIGLVHYRRHFCYRKKKGKNKEDSKWKSVLNSKEAQILCSTNDVVVPNKRHYIIETLNSHYSHTHYEEHLDKTKKIIEQYYPDYLYNYETILSKTSGYMFNMFIMRSDLLDDYCNFLFDILFKLYNQVDTNGYSAFQARYLGRVSEILFNVWLDKKVKIEKVKIKEIKCIHMEPINWYKKGFAFIKAKLMGSKYEHGF